MLKITSQNTLFSQLSLLHIPVISLPQVEWTPWRGQLIDLVMQKNKNERGPKKLEEGHGKATTARKGRERDERRPKNTQVGRG
jgi:hypothetical protein